jgi:hypothetical protein
VDLDKVNETVANILVNQREDLLDVFSYFAINNEKQGDITLSKQGELVNNSNLSLGDMEDSIISLLSNVPTRLTPSIFVLENSVVLYLWGGGEIGPYEFRIVFNIQNDFSLEFLYTLSQSPSKIAKHWYVTLDAIGV